MSAMLIAEHCASGHWPGAVERWTPPPHALRKLREWTPLDGQQIFEDLANVLDHWAPEPSDLQ